MDDTASLEWRKPSYHLKQSRLLALQPGTITTPSFELETGICCLFLLLIDLISFPLNAIVMTD
jgi:hypothetical protein